MPSFQFPGDIAETELIEHGFCLEAAFGIPSPPPVI
jgi:hypothetical protein